MDLTCVINRLKQYELQEYNNIAPIIFVEAKDPDHACYLSVHNLASKILKKDHSIESIEFTKEIMNDVRIHKIELANEKKL